MGHRKRVLVVDDEPEVRRAVAGILADAGHDVQTAIDGDHALRSALALAPDCILLDIRLPEPSFALRFAERYRQRVAPDQRAPIIALSGGADIAPLSKQLGASAFVAKPFAVQDLLAIVEGCLAAGLGEGRAAGDAPASQRTPTG